MNTKAIIFLAINLMQCGAGGEDAGGDPGSGITYT